jgi:hypothetical protein
MCETVAEAQAHVLRLLLGGMSPEEAEDRLAGTGCVLPEPTALTDPTNVLMQEVTDDGAAPRPS